MTVRKGTRRRARKHGLAGLAALGSVVVAGVVAGWGVTPVETREITPSEVVALRFPDDWNDDATGSVLAARAGGYRLASADAQPLDADILFSPHPTLTLSASTMALAPADGRNAPAAAPAPKITVQASAEPKTEPRTEHRTEHKPELKPAVKAAARTDVQPQPEVRTAPTRSLAPPPERHAAPAAHKDSGTPFNDAQLASIKRRLNLSPYQEQYWPGVEAALREIGLRAAHESHAGARGNARLAAIDPDGPEVAHLKSAAFPLIMSMNDEQKQQVRMLAQVMGLERVAASF